MGTDNPDTTYRVVLRDDMSYGVEVAIPGSSPTLVTSFPTEKKAEDWIVEHKRRLVEVASNKSWRRRR